jgi:RHS repeat-associated protein
MPLKFPIKALRGSWVWAVALVLVGWLCLRAEPTFLTETLQYDEWGNLWKRTDFAGKTTTFGYDTLNRLKSKSADATHPSLAYSHAIARSEFDYDTNGARTVARTYNAANTLLYTESTPRDERGRLTYKDTAAGRLDYGYYANNFLRDTVAGPAAGGAATTGLNLGYRYDEANRLESVDDTSTGLPTRTTGYTYNANGSLETLSTPNAVVHTYGYDPLNRLRGLIVSRGTTLLRTYEYKLKPSGHRHQTIEGTGRTTDYTYDDLYRLTAETVAADPATLNGVVDYALDKVGNRESRTSQISNLNSQVGLTYNPRDWISTDTHTANGSTLTSTQLSPLNPQIAGHTDTYDFEERLILRTRADGTTINLTYDADGHRVQKNILSPTATPVSTTSWLIDTNNHTGYAQVVEERVTTSTDTTLRVFTYGQALISQAVSLNAQPPTLSYVGTDGFGTVRQLTDASGTPTDAYDFDAFGNLLRRTGATTNAYLYRSEQYDADLGLYYLRARYLNPDSGRFWSMDSYEGSSSDPISLHKYLYANADPVGMFDPTGNAALAQFTTAMAIAFNLGIRMIPVAMKVTWFGAEVAGVTTAGLGVGRGVVAIGTAVERSVPPGVTIGDLLVTALKLGKGVSIGSHRYVKKMLAGTGGQSGHLNQSAAFPAAVVDDALTIAMQGSTATKGSEHWRFHSVLERFWQTFRDNPFLKPTNGGYNEALRHALAETDVNPAAIDDLVRLAEKTRAVAGYFDGPNGLPPVVPGALPMPK